MVKGAFLSVTVLSLSNVRMRESKEMRCCSSLPDTFKVIMVLSGTTKGLALRL